MPSKRLSPTTVIAMVALVLALGGTAVATRATHERAISKAQIKKLIDKRLAKAASRLTVADSAALGGRPASDYQLAGSEPYRIVGASGQPPLTGSWTNFGGGFATAAFYRDPIGIVHLRGVITGPTNGVTAFTLPPGYRPGAVESFAGNGGAGAGVDINANGEVSPYCPNPGPGCPFLSLSGISFRAEG